MVSTNPFILSDKQPVLLLKTVVHPDSSIELFYQNANSGFFEFFEFMEDITVSDEPILQLLQDDQQSIDEWTEFIVKIMNKPSKGIYDTGENDHQISNQILQFFQKIKGWAVTTVTFDKRSNYIQLSFAKPDDTKILMNVRNLMEAKNTAWLGSFVGKGSYWEIDLRSQTIFLARRMVQDLGIGSSARIIPLSEFLALSHPDDLPDVVEAITNVEKVNTLVFNRGITNDGNTIFYNSYALPSYDHHGRMTKLMGLSQNITEKELTMEKLVLSEKRFRSIVENSKDFFILTDADGHYIYTSPNISSMFHIDSERLIGKKLGYTFVCDEDRSMVQETIESIFKNKTSGEIVCRICCPDGSLHWIKAGISTILDRDGNVAEATATARDITEEKEHEEHLMYLGTHDSLTGVYNRFYFEQELKRIQDEGIIEVGLIMADLNGLKIVNDAFDHAQGDKLLIDTAKLLRENCTESHFLARIGGDEFALLVYNTSWEKLDKMCDRLKEECAKTADQVVPLNISWGIAFRYNEDLDMPAIYKLAEGRLYNNKMLESSSMHSQIISSLKEALKSRNVETSDHMQRMENMVIALGKRLGLNASEFDRLVLLASMHDIGKVAIPDDIINKPGKLTLDEWVVMKSHCEVGYRIAMASQELSSIANEILCHHERWDGLGYPSAKKGKEAPLLSRIISVVDAYDVMTHKRVYKNSVSHEDAVQELIRCAGKQFDPDIVGLFIDIFGDFTEGEMRKFSQQELSAGF